MAQQYPNFKLPFRAGPMYGNLGSPPNQNQRNFAGGNRRMLMRELIIKKISENETVGYYMNVVPSPLNKVHINGVMRHTRYDGLEHGDPDLAPWVILRSRFTPNQEVTFPISICAKLRKHLLSCADEHLNDNGLDSSGDSQLATPDNSVFSVSKLTEVDFQDQAVGCSLRILSQDENHSDECDTKRFLVSCPIAPSGVVSSTDDSNSKPIPLHLRKGTVELHEALLPNLITFLSDICVRYQTLELTPQINFLYSASGERRFFFDVRNTQYGNRLHIAQVTDLHRNVVGIPLESMVDFRDRLSQIIDLLHLEDGKDLRDALERRSSRPIRRRPPYMNQPFNQLATNKPASASSTPATNADGTVATTARPKGGRPQNQKPRARNTPSASQKVADVGENKQVNHANGPLMPPKTDNGEPRRNAWHRTRHSSPQNATDARPPQQRRKNTPSNSQKKPVEQQQSSNDVVQPSTAPVVEPVEDASPKPQDENQAETSVGVLDETPQSVRPAVPRKRTKRNRNAGKQSEAVGTEQHASGAINCENGGERTPPASVAAETVMEE